MLQEIQNLGNADPKVSKNAALKIFQHVSKNKDELNYLVRRLVTGMESTKVSTRAGAYSTLTTLLSLQKVDPFDLFGHIQKELVTSKENSKKERRLIYIARILCTGAIFRTIPVVNLAKDESFFQAALKDLVDLSQKKSTYFQLATPFLSHILQDGTLTQDTFDSLVWPSISCLFFSKSNKKKDIKDDDTSEEEENAQDAQDAVAVNSANFCCIVQLAMDSKNGEYRNDFDCLNDVEKIAKSFLAGPISFQEIFLNAIFKHLSTAPSTEIGKYFGTIVENIKSTQFELLCLSVKKAIGANISITSIVSKNLLRLLLSVFKLDDKEFHKQSRETIELLLNWNSKKVEDDKSATLGKKQRKVLLKIFFEAEDPPNLLHEYKYLHSVLRPFFLRLKSHDLEILESILVANLFEEKSTEKLGPRMAIVYLQTLGRIGLSQKASSEVKFEVGKRLLGIAQGIEEVSIKIKEETSEDKQDSDENSSSLTEIHGQLKNCALDTLNLILSSTQNFEFISMLSSHIMENSSEFTKNQETLNALKSIRKALKKLGSPHLEYILKSHSIRVLLDESQTINSAGEIALTLIEIAKSCKSTDKDQEDLAELWKFITTTVVRDPNPAFNYEWLFNKLLIEGKVKEDLIQVFAEAIDAEFEAEEEDNSEAEEEDNLDSDGDGVDAEEMEVDSDEGEGDNPPRKKSKLDSAQIAKLKEMFGKNEKGDGNGNDSDLEEPIPLDEATDEDLKKMDGALAKVFAVKKSMKEGDRSSVRALMRNLRLVELYIRRNFKGMPASSLLIILMPCVHCLQNSLKLKNSGLPTKVIGILDNLNRVKKFTGCDDVVEGTFASVAEELYEMAIQKKNKLIRELLEHSVILLTKCFLTKEGKRSKKEQKRFIELYSKAVDAAKKKMKSRRKIIAKNKKNRKLANVNTSRFVRLALEVLPEWAEGRKAITARIELDEN